jgi:hypothetical protein
MSELVPPIEENIPLPENAKEAFPDLSPAEELQQRANVVKLMSDMTGQVLTPSKENVEEATELARQMTSDPALRPDLAFLAGMVAQMNVSIVDELSEFKMYVVNKLVAEIENARDSKARITALTKLGEIDGVDAFKKRTEITHKHQSIEEVESELLETLSKLKSRTIDVQAKDVTDVNDT